jgi:hypothetical protein
MGVKRLRRQTKKIIFHLKTLAQWSWIGPTMDEQGGINSVIVTKNDIA